MKRPALLALLLFSVSRLTCFAQSTTQVQPQRTVLYRPGDFDSQFFRIPAVITAKDGSLVAAADRRKYSNTDLPEDIDILLNHSTDGGLSWSGPQFLAIGTVGLYVEEDPHGGEHYEMVFYNFSLEWLEGNLKP